MADGEAKSIYGPLDADLEEEIVKLREDVKRHEEWIMASLDEKAELLDDLDTLTEILVDILDEVSDNEEMVKLSSIQNAMKSLNYRA